MGAVHTAKKVGLHDFLYHGQVLDLLEQCPHRNARIVHQDVNAFKLLYCPAD